MSRKSKQAAAAAVAPAAVVSAPAERQDWLARLHSARMEFAVAAVIAVAVLLVFNQVTRFTFSSLDADTITANDLVGNGLTWLGVKVAFTDQRLGSWVPFTWISHMLDVQWYGLDPAAHHRTSLLLHLINAALAFISFRMISGARWPSAIAALLFALHPLRAQSVAWLPGRQGLLGGMFCFLAIMAWLRSQRHGSALMYWLCVASAACAALSTPAAIVLPLVLLLISSGTPVARLLPVSAASVLAILVWLFRGGAQGVGTGLFTGFAPAIVQTFWPVRLTPVGEQGHVAGAAVIAVLVGLAFLARMRMPIVFQGLLWFVASLLVALAAAELNKHTYADRFTYFAHAGLMLAIVFGVRALLGSFAGHPAVVIPACLVAAACAWQAWVQTGYWSSDVILFQRSIDLDPSNRAAYGLLGNALVRAQQADLAQPFLRKAAELDPRSATARLNLAEALFIAGDNQASLAEIDTALKLDPNSGRIHAHRGTVLRAAGKLEEAKAEFQKGLDLGLTREVKLQALLNLGLVDNKLGNFVDAIKYFQLALQEEPKFFLARKNLAFAYLRMQQNQLAQSEFDKLYVTNPDDEDIQKALRYLSNKK